MKKPRIFLGCDHAGFELKEDIKKFLEKQGFDYEDLGVNDNSNSYDYPATALEVAKKAVKHKGMGILMCGTGIGESIVANKVKGIRAANCFNEYTAQMSREHNNSNVLCLGARVLDKDSAKKIAKIWLETEFSKEARHRRRVRQISEIENQVCR